MRLTWTVIFIGWVAGCAVSKSDAAPPPTTTKAPPSVRPAVRTDGAVPARALAGSHPPPGLRCLQQGYPDAITAVEETPAGWAVAVGSARFVWDDGAERSFEEKLASPDLSDQLSIPYPRGALSAPPEVNHDPGRVRCSSFFKAVYGADQEAVAERLVPVQWLPSRGGGRSLPFNRENRAAEQLFKVSRELDARLSPGALRHVTEPAGTFNWRTIAGTDRLSAHAFGIAIDINVDGSDYWRWGMKGGLLRYRNRIPFEIVSIFEAHGFIWGGKWYHFDTMHFEYRPELLVTGCAVPPAGEALVEPHRAGPTAAVAHESAAATPVYPWPHDRAAARVRERFPPPDGFRRVIAPAGSFGHWLQHLPVKPGAPPVRLFDGRLKENQDAHAAVLDIDVGKRDLQQCADAAMRLWAEYLRSIRRDDFICFRTAAGGTAAWSRWQRGERPTAAAPREWRRSAGPDNSYQGFRRYLDRVFGMANTASILRQMDPVDAPRDVRHGDVFIEGATNRGYGHAVIVIDVAEHPSTGERRFLLAQSYMPAQDIHVLKNPSDERSIWFAPTDDGSLVTPEWRFGPGALHRFRDGGC